MLTVKEVIECLQEFPSEAKVKFAVSGVVTGTVAVVTDAWFSDAYGYDCTTEDRDAEIELEDQEVDLEGFDDKDGSVLIDLSLS